MLYVAIDKEVFRTRKEVRKHCRSLGLGKNIKENYLPVPQSAGDHASLLRTIGKKEYKKKSMRFRG